MSKSRVSIRISANQEQVLREMCEVFDTSISMMVRTIVGSWLSEHEDEVERAIIRKRKEKNGENK